MVGAEPGPLIFVPTPSLSSMDVVILSAGTLRPKEWGRLNAAHEGDGLPFSATAFHPPRQLTSGLLIGRRICPHPLPLAEKCDDERSVCSGARSSGCRRGRGPGSGRLWPSQPEPSAPASRSGEIARHKTPAAQVGIAEVDPNSSPVHGRR